MLIETMVQRMDMPHVVEQLRKLEQYGLENEAKYPWMPSAWNKAALIETMVQRMDMPHVVEQLRKLEQYGLENEAKYPWMPSAWNKAAASGR